MFVVHLAAYCTRFAQLVYALSLGSVSSNVMRDCSSDSLGVVLASGLGVPTPDVGTSN